MGIFDIIELKNHCQAIGEYVFYEDSHPSEVFTCHALIRDHLKNMFSILDKMEKSF